MTTMTKTMAAWSLAALITTAACDGSSGAGGRASFRDSAGVRIAENVTPDDSAAHVWWTVGEVVFDIGGAEAVEPYVIDRAVAAVRQPDGSIVIASGVSSDVRVFSASGEHLRTTGRKGGGPGEFQSIAWMQPMAGDSILVFDGTARRFTVLDPRAGFVRVISTPPDFRPNRVYGRFADGRLLVSVPGSASMSPAELKHNEVSRLPVQIARYAIDQQLADSLGSFAGNERLVRISARPGGEISSIEILTTPFSKTTAFAAGDHEFFVGLQDHPEVLVYDTAGALRRVIRTGRAAEPVTQQHLDARFERQLEQLPTQRAAQMRASGPPDLPHGDVVPPYGELLAGRTGNLWVADYGDPLDPPNRWTIYAPDGALAARIVLPEKFRPLEIGDDYILGRELDDMDAERVRVYRLLTQRR